MATRKRSATTKRKKKTGRDGDGDRKQSKRLKDVTEIDFRDANLLRKCMTEQGKILPARLIGATAKQQRQVARAIRRARAIGFIS
jgi:small subunit ribosomal protein S18